MLSGRSAIRVDRSDLPLAAAASGEVRNLRSVRDELLRRRSEIDRELKTVDGLIATYIAYRPALAGPSDRKGRAMNLGAKLSKILAAHPGRWVGLAELSAEASHLLPGIELTENRLRNALYHLVKTQRVESKQADSGIQYRLLSTTDPGP